MRQMNVAVDDGIRRRLSQIAADTRRPIRAVVEDLLVAGLEAKSNSGGLDDVKRAIGILTAVMIQSGKLDLGTYRKMPAFVVTEAERLLMESASMPADQ